MTGDRQVAESLAGLRRLAQDPSPEAARELLSDWAERSQMYDTTASAWRPAREQERP